MNSEIILKNK